MATTTGGLAVSHHSSQVRWHGRVEDAQGEKIPKPDGFMII